MYYVETLTQNKSLFILIVLKNNSNTLNMTYLNSMIQLYIYYEYYIYLYILIRLVCIIILYTILYTHSHPIYYNKMTYL
jgi:hypothetical protein